LPTQANVSYPAPNEAANGGKTVPPAVASPANGEGRRPK